MKHRDPNLFFLTMDVTMRKTGIPIKKTMVLKAGLFKTLIRRLFWTQGLMSTKRKNCLPIRGSIFTLINGKSCSWREEVVKYKYHSMLKKIFYKCACKLSLFIAHSNFVPTAYNYVVKPQHLTDIKGTQA
jgi:hypothetical protein